MADQEAGPSGATVKISVLASGGILLDGREVSLNELDEALQEAKLQGATVQYFRENAAGPAPPEAESVIRLVAGNRMRIALSTKPDFSDATVIKPPAAAPPKVIEFPGIETLFAKVRKQAAGSHAVSLLRPDQILFVLPAPPPGSINEQMVAAVRGVVASEQPRNIAAIASRGALAGDPSRPPPVPDVARKVPFFGLLMGLAYVGHTVWLFEGVPQMATAGCEDADVLIVDSAAVGTLPPGWEVDASLVMRNANILIFDRAREKVGALRTAGKIPGRLEFPN